jgi:hypothetical protein
MKLTAIPSATAAPFESLTVALSVIIPGQATIVFGAAESARLTGVPAGRGVLVGVGVRVGVDVTVGVLVGVLVGFGVFVGFGVAVSAGAAIA